MLFSARALFCIDIVGSLFNLAKRHLLLLNRTDGPAEPITSVNRVNPGACFNRFEFLKSMITILHTQNQRFDALVKRQFLKKIHPIRIN